MNVAPERLYQQGMQPVEPGNSYWKSKRLTFEDPDGYRVGFIDPPGLLPAQPLLPLPASMPDPAVDNRSQSKMGDDLSYTITSDLHCMTVITPGRKYFFRKVKYNHNG